jgi:hypothetical protein
LRLCMILQGACSSNWYHINITPIKLSQILSVINRKYSQTLGCITHIYQSIRGLCGLRAAEALRSG